MKRQSVPYRKSMDPGCGSATVLMPLQVLLSSCYGRKALIRSNTVYFWMLDNLNSLLVTNTMRLEITWKLLTRFHFQIRVDILDICLKRMRIQMFWILVQKKNTYLSIKSFYSALAEVSYAEVRLNFNLQKGVSQTPQNPAPVRQPSIIRTRSSDHLHMQQDNLQGKKSLTTRD